MTEPTEFEAAEIDRLTEMVQGVGGSSPPPGPHTEGPARDRGAFFASADAQRRWRLGERAS